MTRWTSSISRVLAASCALALGTVTIASIPSSAATAPITGTIFRDLDHDGERDADEQGWPDVTVTAIAPDGSTATATSAADGSYSIAETDDGTSYRVEFSWAEEWLAAAPVGADNATATQFVSGGGTANFAVATADDFCAIGDGELGFATTCFINGDATIDGSSYADAPAIVSVHGAADGAKGDAGANPPAPTVLADNTTIGSTYGLAWQPSAQRMFTSAFMKRHIGLGVGGIDAIYVVEGGNASVFYTAIDAGTVASNADRGLPTDTADPTSLDLDAFAQVGKVGWGDIDLSADEATLYAANLADRSIYAIDVAAAAGGSTSAHTSLGAPAHSCSDGSPGRVFGIEIHDGTLWAAVTCGAEVSGATSDLSAAVYGYDLGAGSWAATPAIDFGLDYTKGCSKFNTGCGFQTWLDTYSDAAFGLVPDPSPYEGPTRSQPLVSDLEIDADGSLIIGIRDRSGDQFGHRNLSPAGDGNLVTGYSGGDLLRAAPAGDGTWVLEQNGSVGGVSTSGTGDGPTGQGGANTNQGPGGGEFYADDFVFAWGDRWHSETTLGGLALAPGRSSVAVTNTDPLTERLDAAGISWFDNTTGLTVNEYELYRDGAQPQPQTLGKANGLGDLESMCPAAPLQIGDRVWFDRDGDGIQDGDEPGIPGVKVMVSVEGGDPITVVTGPDGTWNLSVAPFTTYTIMIDPSMADVSGIAEVNSPDELAPTLMDAVPADGAANEIDSDMDVDTLKITAVTAGPGQNDHSFDAGFIVGETSLEIGNLVWLDNDNDGVAEMGEPGIADVTVELWIDADGDGVKDTKIDETTTDADGYYAFSGLAKNVYFINIPPQASEGQPLFGLESSTPASDGADDDQDNDDNGLTMSDTTATVMSDGVSLMTGTEPVNEVSRDGKTDRDASPTDTTDADSNLSVDFGFFPVAKVGDTVWYDSNGDGVQDVDETGVPGVTVHLCDADMTPLETAVTDENGMYMFGGLTPGMHMVCFDLDTLPDGYAPTISDAGDDDAADSDADPDTGKTPGVEVAGGEQDLTLDLGIVGTAKLGDTVWYDSNGDGVQDVDEAGVPGVTVHLCDADMTPLETAVTDENGMYMFGGLTPGMHMVCFDLDTLPDGFGPTISNVGDDDAVDSDADPVTGKTEGVEVIGEVLTLDLGIVELPTSPAPTPDTPAPTPDTPAPDTPAPTPDIPLIPTETPDVQPPSETPDAQVPDTPTETPTETPAETPVESPAEAPAPDVDAQTPGGGDQLPLTGSSLTTRLALMALALLGAGASLVYRVRSIRT